jgi:hypothetical protein
MAENEKSLGRIGKLTEHARGMLHRHGTDDAEGSIISSDEAEVGSPEEFGVEQAELDRLSSDALRDELHAAVDEVMERNATDLLGGGTLKHALDHKIHKVVDERLSSRSLWSRVVHEVQATWGKVGTPVVSVAGGSIDEATARLQAALLAVYGQAKPTAARTLRLIPALVPVIAGFLFEYINDEEKLSQVQKKIEAILVDTFHVKAGVAHAMVDIATKVAQTFHRRKGKVNGETKSQDEGNNAAPDDANRGS